MRQMTVRMKCAIDEVRAVFGGLKRAAADGRHAERAGQKTCDRLVAQTERAKRLADRLDQATNRLAHTVVVRKSPRINIIKEASKPVVGLDHLPPTVPDDSPLQSRFEEMLNGSRNSLSDLRTLVRGRVRLRCQHAATPKSEIHNRRL